MNCLDPEQRKNLYSPNVPIGVPAGANAFSFHSVQSALSSFFRLYINSLPWKHTKHQKSTRSKGSGGSWVALSKGKNYAAKIKWFGIRGRLNVTKTPLVPSLEYCLDLEQSVFVMLLCTTKYWMLNWQQGKNLQNIKLNRIPPSKWFPLERQTIRCHGWLFSRQAYVWSSCRAFKVSKNSFG